MSNTNGTKWTFQHETAVDASGQHLNVNSSDLRGLKLRLESGYTWMNKNDGTGWIQTSIVIRRLEIRKAVGL